MTPKRHLKMTSGRHRGASEGYDESTDPQGRETDFDR